MFLLPGNHMSHNHRGCSLYEILRRRELSITLESSLIERVFNKSRLLHHEHRAFGKLNEATQYAANESPRRRRLAPSSRDYQIGRDFLRAQSEMEKLLMGSVSAKVSKLSDVSVTVVT